MDSFEERKGRFCREEKNHSEVLVFLEDLHVAKDAHPHSASQSSLVILSTVMTISEDK